MSGTPRTLQTGIPCAGFQRPGDDLVDTRVGDLVRCPLEAADLGGRITLVILAHFVEEVLDIWNGLI
jgi:hypothetical protein